MAEPKIEVIVPTAVDVGESPDVPGVVSNFYVSDDRCLALSMSPADALSYAALLTARATQMLAGSVRVSSREETSGASLTLERTRAPQLDS